MGFRGYLASAAVFTGSLAGAQRSAWPVVPKDPRGFEVGVWNYYPQTASPTPGHTVHNLLVAFDNRSAKEVRSVKFEMSLLKNGKVVAKRGPIHVDRFLDHYFMSRHGAVPGQRAFADLPLSFDLPVGAWEPRDGARVKILSYEVADGRDLHDLGHFATWLKTASDEEVEAAVQRDPSLREVRNEDGYSALAVAYFFGTRRKVDALYRRTFGEASYLGGMRAFHLAVRNPKIEVLDAILAQGGDVNALNNAEVTPLMIAINEHSTSAARWLLRHGAKVDLVDKAGWSALRYAIRTGDAVLVRLLVDHGARLSLHSEGFGPLHWATARGDRETMETLLSGGISPNDVDAAYGITPLMAAAKYRNYVAARWLLEHGARLDARDIGGKDAFDYARESDPSHSDEALRRVAASVKNEN